MEINSKNPLPSQQPKQPFYQTPYAKAALAAVALTAIGALAYYFSSTSLPPRLSTPLKDGEIPLLPGFDQCKLQFGPLKTPLGTVHCTGPNGKEWTGIASDLESFSAMVQNMKRDAVKSLATTIDTECSVPQNLDAFENMAKGKQYSQSGNADLFARYERCGWPTNERYQQILSKYFSSGTQDSSNCPSCQLV